MIDITLEQKVDDLTKKVDDLTKIVSGLLMMSRRMSRRLKCKELQEVMEDDL